MNSALTIILTLTGAFCGGCSLYFTLLFFQLSEGGPIPLSEFGIPIIGFLFSGLFFFLAWTYGKKQP